jgi:hypothetical protein
LAESLVNSENYVMRTIDPSAPSSASKKFALSHGLYKVNFDYYGAKSISEYIA